MKVSKKAITILTICLLVITGTQNTQAQSKEETIAWIKEKLMNYGGRNYTTIEVTPCYIIETFNSDDGSRAELKWTNPINVPIRYEINDDNKIIFLYESKLSRGGDVGGKIRTSKEGISLTNSETDLAERMLKALKHLATFCTEKKQPF